MLSFVNAGLFCEPWLIVCYFEYKSSEVHTYRDAQLCSNPPVVAGKCSFTSRNSDVLALYSGCVCLFVCVFAYA